MSECCTIDFGDSLGSNVRIDFRRDLFVRQLGSPACPLHDPPTVRSEQTELDLGPSAEPLLTRAILHFQRKAEHVKTGVHCLVEYRRRNLGVRELGIHRESQLNQAGALLVEVSSSTCEALYHDVREILLEMPEMMWNVLRNEGQASLETSDHIAGIDIRSCIVDDDRNTKHLIAGDRW